mgnify:CR=1 FL=1
MNKQKNMIMSAAAAVVLVAVNVGVFMAAGKGAIAPINNMLMWGAFVALNIASILWAVGMLGLHPLVVSISYVAGGFLAFQGVRGMSGVSVAEVTTAGATYGAFGALAIGNATTKVRLAFFDKAQVPFIFIIVGLLVIDAVLNSQITNAGGSVMLNAVVFPFVLAGVIVGLLWSVLNRYGVGKKPSEVLAEADAFAAASSMEKVEAISSDKLVIKMPEDAVVAKKESVAKPVKKVEVVKPLAPAAKAKPAPVAKAPKIEPKKEEEFFPLEIDKGEEVAETVEEPNILDIMANIESEPAKAEAFEAPTFDTSRYASRSMDEDSDGGVMVKEPEVVVAEPEPAPKPVVAAPEPEPVVAEAKPEPTPEPAPKEKSDDWLGGHLDLLNKLK